MPDCEECVRLRAMVARMRERAGELAELLKDAQHDAAMLRATFGERHQKTTRIAPMVCPRCGKLATCACP